jgi:osmotically-inducible protein OsmY
VRLTGTVPNEDARVTAATTARSTRGVRAVLWEDLKVSSADAH